MKRNKRGPLLLLVTLAFLLILPLGMYLAVTQTDLRRRADAGDIVVNILPPSKTIALGEPFDVDISLNTDGQKVSAVTVSLDIEADDGAVIEVVDFSAATADVGSFTHIVEPTEDDPYTFTLLARVSDDALPSGSNLEIATYTLRATASGTAIIALNEERSYAVGVTDQNDDGIYNAVSGLTGTYTIVGELCRAQACVPAENIELVAEPRDDRRFNVQASWQGPASGYTVYNLYRSIGSPVSENHPDNQLVTRTSNTEYTDTNEDNGFEELTDIHYDIDSYIVCPDSIQDPTATPDPDEPTNTPAPGQPTNTPAPADDVLTLSHTSGTITGGRCELSIEWDFTGYEDVIPRITRQVGSNAEEVICGQVTGCTDHGNPFLERITETGDTIYRVRIANGLVEESHTFTCNPAN